MKPQKVETVEKTDFECGQIDALNKIKSSIQKWVAELENTNFGQLKVLSQNDDLFFTKLNERIITAKNIVEQINDIAEQI